LLQSVLNECSSSEIDVGFSNREQVHLDRTKHRRKKSWQTIVKEIRAVRVVSRRRAVKVVVVVRELEAVKGNSRADSKAARVATVASKVAAKRAVNRTGSISVSRGEFAL
jgi:hypothetical protein